MHDGTGDQRKPQRGIDDLLEHAARYVQSVRGAPGRVPQARALLDRPGSTALVALLRSLPAVEAPFSGSQAGRELRGWFGPGRLLAVDRAPVAVLRLPPTAAEYVRGRSRQALRTNLAIARRSGITVTDVIDEADLHRICGHIAAVRRTTPDVYLASHVRPGPHSLLSAAYDAAGDPLALSHVVVDGAWAGLGFMVTAIDHGESQLARYVLQAHMAGVLIERGVRNFTVGGSMLLSSPGIRYFQRRTGFQPVRLRLVPSPTRRRDATGGKPDGQLASPPAVEHSPQQAREAEWTPHDQTIQDRIR